MIKRNILDTRYKSDSLGFVKFRVSNLVALSGDRVLFKNIDIALNAGEALWLRGDNGSGKSTLLMMLAGLLQPYRGKFHDPENHYPENHYIGHNHGLDYRDNVKRTLNLWVQLYEQSGKAGFDCRCLLAHVGLDIADNVWIHQLSQGQQRRLALLRLLLAPRRLWLLDEPETALDDAGKILLHNWLQWHLEMGGMLIFTSHYQSLIANFQQITL